MAIVCDKCVIFYVYCQFYLKYSLKATLVSVCLCPESSVLKEFWLVLFFQAYNFKNVRSKSRIYIFYFFFTA